MKTKCYPALSPSAADCFIVAVALLLVQARLSASTFTDANWMSLNRSMPGAGGNVYAATVDGSGNLYIGGSFGVVGEITANNIAKWDGNRWSTLGSGMDGLVFALAVSGGDLYAAGRFNNAGDSPANNIAKWDGTTWSPLGSGTSSTVTTLAVSGPNLYAGGGFHLAGGIAATNIAKWDGRSWSAVGSGVDFSGECWCYPVAALAICGSTLYAGGVFTNADAVAVNYIARWDGTRWSALGSGMDGYVYALAVSGSELYAGGVFETAGGKVSPYIACAYLLPLPQPYGASPGQRR